MLIKTARLQIVELKAECLHNDNIHLLEQIPNILTPEVVRNLPPYFHGVDSKEKATKWLEFMLSESHLFLVNSFPSNLAGFIFVSEESEKHVHLGYLLAKSYWGQGLASEMLQGFIAQVSLSQPWLTFVAGVDRSNVASANLLKKLGFVERTDDNSQIDFYEYSVKNASVT